MQQWKADPEQWTTSSNPRRRYALPGLEQRSQSSSFTLPSCSSWQPLTFVYYSSSSQTQDTSPEALNTSGRSKANVGGKGLCGRASGPQRRLGRTMAASGPVLTPDCQVVDQIRRWNRLDSKTFGRRIASFAKGMAVLFIAPCARTGSLTGRTTAAKWIDVSGRWTTSALGQIPFA